MRKKFFKTVSALLIVTNLMGEYGRIAYAAEDESAAFSSDHFDEEDYENETLIESDDESEMVEESEMEDSTYADSSKITDITLSSNATIVGEIIEERDEYSKSYLMSDNSTCIALYEEPVHYETEDGNFAEIDNSVVETKEGYVNADNTYQVLFTDNDESKGEVKFSEDSYAINFEYIDTSVEDSDIEDYLSERKSVNSDSNGEIDLSLDADLNNTESNPLDSDDELEVSAENELSESDENGVHTINSSVVTIDGYNDGISLSYEPTSTGIKENIVLPDARSGNKFTFRLDLMGLKARLTKENEVQLYDENTERVMYYIPAPFMMDSDENYSEDVWYSLSSYAPDKEGSNASKKEHENTTSDENADGGDDIVVEEVDEKEEVTEDFSYGASNDNITFESKDICEDIMIDREISADMQDYSDEAGEDEVFIENDEEEHASANDCSSDDEASTAVSTEDVFKTTSYYDENSDYVYLTLTADENWLSNASFPVTIDPIIKKVKNDYNARIQSVNSFDLAEDNCFVGRNKDGNLYRTFVWFELPKIDKGSMVTNAELYLEGTASSSNKHYITVKKVDSYWKNINCWNDQPKINDRTVDYAVKGGFFNITKPVRDWLSGENNNGLVFMAYNEDENICDKIALSKTVKKPFLKVTYKNYVGLEDYFSSHELAVGTAGMGYINDYTGALTIVNTDVYTNGERMPFNIQHVFNSGKSIDTSWKLSYEEKIIIPVGKTDIKEFPYEYIDGDGTSHFFKASDVTYQENGTSRTVKKPATANGTLPPAADEDGLKLYIVPVSDKKLKEKYPLKMLDKSGSTVKYFDKSGNLALITDSNQFENGNNEKTNIQNKISFEFDTQKIEKEISPGFEDAIELLDIISKLYVRVGVATIGEDGEPIEDEESIDDIHRARLYLEELMEEDCARADYQIGLNIQKAHDSIRELYVGQFFSDHNKVRSAAASAKASLTKAYERAKTFELYDEKLVSVTDAVGNVSRIGYENGRIVTISDPTRYDKNTKKDLENNYSYDEKGRLIRIDYSNGKHAYYDYDEDDNLISMQDDSGYKIEFKYAGGKISEVSESATNKEKQEFKGQNYTIEYNSNNYTTYRFSGIDDIYGNEDDIYNTYVFDENGRVITQYSSKEDIEVLGAQSFSYGDNAVKHVARLDYDDQDPDAHPNLIKNSDFEKELSNWKVEHDNGTAERRFVTASPEKKYRGKHSLKLAPSTGDYAEVSQKVENLSAGAYSLSFWRKMETSADKFGLSINADGEEKKYNDAKPVQEVDGWILFTGWFEITETANAKVSFITIDDAAVYIDCVHLEKGKECHNYSTTEAPSQSASSDGKTDNPYERNKIKDTAITGRQTQNLLKNHSFEEDGEWVKFGDSYYAENIVTMGKPGNIDGDSSNAYIGDKAAIINLQYSFDSYSGLYQDVTIPKTGRYTLSCYVKANNLNLGEAYLKVIPSNGDEQISEKITRSTPSGIRDGWERLKISFDAEKGENVRVCLGAVGKNEFGVIGIGKVIFDCIQLEEGNVANDYNILEDGSFELAAGDLPYTWMNLKKNTIYADEIISGGIDGGRCYHITGEPGKDKLLKCNVHLGDETRSYVLSGWIKTDTTPIRNKRELKVQLFKDEDQYSSMELDDFSEGWKYFSLIIPAHKWGDSLFEIHFYDNIGDLYIDNLQLSRVDVSTRRYDKNGKLTGVCVSERQSSYTYDTFDRMKTMITPGGVKQTYIYDKTNHNTEVRSDLGPYSYMTYDKFGNKESISVHVLQRTDENGNQTHPLELYSKNIYSDDGNYLKETTGNNGAKTAYEFDEKRGLLKSEILPEYGSGIRKPIIYHLLEATDTFELIPIDPYESDNKGDVRLDYGYDDFDRINKVSRHDDDKKREITYEYGDFSDLDTITHNGFKYEYTYDAFGNVLTTSIAGKITQTNVYKDENAKDASYNGSLKKTTYADGVIARSSYDEYGNVTDALITVPGEEEKSTDHYEYYNDGKLALHADKSAEVDTEYEYNDKGKICRTKVLAATSDGKIDGVNYDSRLQYIYNTMGKVQEMYYEAPEGETYVQKDYTYTYAKDGSNVKDILPDKSFKEFKYDSLRRTNKTIYSPTEKTTADKRLYTSIMYAEGKSSKKSLIGTTENVSGFYNSIGDTTKNTAYGKSYEYDKKGNIIEIHDAELLKNKVMCCETPSRSYAYNCFGEVVKANEHYTGIDDGIQGTTYEYTYDDGGNILTETVSVDGKAEEPIKYTYDSVWKDKLISYDGKVITYDLCGNPLNYLGKEMKWNSVNGSLLSIKEGDDTYEYTYFSDGQRLSKKVGGQNTVYIYNAGMLLAEETENDRLNFYYDADGLIIEIGYQRKDGSSFGEEKRYFFTRNGQGDIVGIYRCSDSTLVGNYEYDLWGNLVSVIPNKEVTDTDDILNRNPLRYRGYYYDAETGFYYLSARYYDPKVHRFISADTVIAGVSGDTNGYNLFAYCNNDPVNQMDASGNWPQLSNKQKIAVGLAVIAAAAVLTVATAGMGGPVACFALGALEGSVMGAASGAVSGAAISGGIAFVTSGGDLEKTKQAAIDGACDGFMSGAITGFISGGMNSPHCFVAGTAVLTAAGKKGIEHIREGDLVLSKDTDTGEITYKRVLETYVSETTELIHLNVDGEEIITTPAHPFYVKDKGFVLAGDLEVGTTLIDNEGNELHLQIVRWEQLQNPVPVYNFAVEEFHTYFVGNFNALVHNLCDTGTGKYEVGAYKDIKGVNGLDAHHVGQKAVMKKFSSAYNPDTAPAINVPKVGHTIKGPNGIVSRSASGIKNARQLLARDLFELKRVYKDIPNSVYRKIIDMNMEMYPELFLKL